MHLVRSGIDGWWLGEEPRLSGAILVTGTTWIFPCAAFGHNRCKHRLSSVWSPPFVGI